MSSIIKNNELKTMEIELDGFKEKHVDIFNEDGVIEITANRRTKVKSTGQKISRSFFFSIEDPDLRDAEVVFSNGKVLINPKKGG